MLTRLERAVAGLGARLLAAALSALLALTSPALAALTLHGEVVSAAREAGLGIWQDPHPTPPWVFRRRP